jgi:hypothetical protein
MGAEFYYQCLGWEKDKPLNFDAGRKIVRELEDSDEAEDILRIIASLEEMLDADYFYHREGAVISLGGVNMLIAAYQGHGDPEECNSLFSDISKISELNDVLYAIGLGSPDEKLAGLWFNRRDMRYLEALRDAHQEGRFDIALEVEELSLEDAVFLGYRAENLTLTNLQKIDSAIAKEIAKCSASLDVKGYSDLSEDAAISLLEHSGDLDFILPCKISEKISESIATHKGELSICQEQNYYDSKTILNEELAAVLSKNQGSLFIWGVTELNADAAKQLSTIKGSLGIYDITEISADVAHELSKHKGEENNNSLSLDSISLLSDEAAGELAKHKGDISFRALKNISDGAAKFLASHSGDLRISGAESYEDQPDLSEEALAFLINKHGTINGKDPADWVASWRKLREDNLEEDAETDSCEDEEN